MPFLRYLIYPTLTLVLTSCFSFNDEISTAHPKTIEKRQPNPRCVPTTKTSDSGTHPMASPADNASSPGSCSQSPTAVPAGNASALNHGGGHPAAVPDGSATSTVTQGYQNLQNEIDKYRFGNKSTATNNDKIKSCIQNLSTDDINALSPADAKKMLAACIDRCLPDEIQQDVILKFFSDHGSLTDTEKKWIALSYANKKISDVKYISSQDSTKKMTQFIIQLSEKITFAQEKKETLSIYLMNLLTAKVQDTNTISLLITAGADVNFPVQVEIVGSIFSLGIQQTYFRRPLTCAVIHGNSFDVIQLLIKSGAEVEKAESSIKLLFHAFKNKLSDETIELLINNGADVNAVYKKLKIHILSYAIEQQVSPKMIQALINKGANIAEAEKDSKSLIMRALDSYQGEKLNELMKILINGGASTLECGEEKNIFNYACSREAPIETIKLLLEHAKPLTDEISSDDIVSHPQGKEVLRLLAGKGVELNVHCLCAAIRGCQSEMLDLLIEYGADVNRACSACGSYGHSRRFSDTTTTHLKGAIYWINVENRNVHRPQLIIRKEIVRKLISAGARITDSVLDEVKYMNTLLCPKEEIYQILLMSRGCHFIIGSQIESSLPKSLQESLKKVATCKAKMQRLYTLIFSSEVSERIASDVSTTKGTFFSLEEINKRIEESTDQFNNHFFSRIARILKICKEHDEDDEVPSQVIDVLDTRGQMDSKNSFLINALHYFYIHLSKASPEECQQEVARVDQLLDNMKSKGLLTSDQYKICADFYQALAKDKIENKNCYLDEYLARTNI